MFDSRSFQLQSLQMACSFLPGIVMNGSDEQFEDQIELIRNIRKELKESNNE